MQAIDWAIVIGLLAILTAGAISTKRYTKSVSAFLAAERCGGKYLISVSNGMAQLGVITMVVWFQIHYDIGFTGFFWGLINEPAFIVMALTGWVVFRFRQTRALTLAQFFEIRYSRSLRVFSGIVAFLAGILNFGIFPSVGARFFISLCGLSETFCLPGSQFQISTFIAIMVFLLVVSVIFTFLGGQIAIMVTDFIQGTFTNVVFVLVILFLLITFTKTQLSDTLLTAETGKSLVNPFDIGKEENFNAIYFFIGVVTLFYGARSWQGTAGYYCSAKNAHEAKMAEIFGVWRWRVMLPIIFIAVAASTHVFLEHKSYETQAEPVHQQLKNRTTQYLNTLSDNSSKNVDKYIKRLSPETRDNLPDNPTQSDVSKLLAVSEGSKNLSKLGENLTQADDLSLLAGLPEDQANKLLELTELEEEQITPDILSNLEGIGTDDPQKAHHLAKLLKDKTDELKSQARIPMALGGILPIGLLGLFCASMLAAFISTHDTYLHSWGSMLVQDVILPFKKKDLEPQTHLWLLKLAILAVAIFIFIFSLKFEHAQRVVMYCNITATVFVGGAGAVIIGGLYWKKATTAGAWTAMVTGLTLSLLGTLITQAGPSAITSAQQKVFWTNITEKLAVINCDGIFWSTALELFETNAQVMTFWVYVICVSLYIIVSLITHKEDFNMDRMLHKGKYEIEGEEVASYSEANTVWEKLGISSDFERFDYVIAALTVAWPIVWIIIFVVLSLIQKNLSDGWWFEYWYYWTWGIFALCIIFTVWFMIGGFFDIKNLYKHLKTFKASKLDDGRVVDHHNVEDKTD